MKIAAGTVFIGLSVFLHSIELSLQGGTIAKSVQCLRGGTERGYPLIPGGDNNHLSKEHLPISEKGRISIMIQGATYILRGLLISDPTYGAWVYNWQEEPAVEERAGVFSQKKGTHFRAYLHHFTDVTFVNTEESECYVFEGKNTYYARLFNDGPDGEALGKRNDLTRVNILAFDPHHENERLLWVGILQRYPKRMPVPDWAQYPQ